ncbi:zinc finger and BTB domain-containing protein 7C [Esox lucius]|uniref:Zinc finger and BTB domain containing 7C n=1 Tax=Esox lucius TaxID=8010 RepID=A0A3P8XUC7_ESOLU|nr:zinc finger and BTB domain-containing protein 7C [Esox lucius]XP_010891094.2 zinc finger and BTB domain-containing protein 7C [Esox lucius]
MAHSEDDLIGIPFPNHSSDVLCCLNEQRRAGLLCDVVLIVRDQEYRTHRSVLAACSQYFKKLFTVASDRSDQHGVYEIDFVAPESLTAILEFAYTSTLTVTASNVKEILEAAQLLEIPCIINVCLEIMGAGEGTRVEEEEEDEEEEDVDEEDEEDEIDEEEEETEESRKDEQEDNEENANEKLTRSSESQDQVGSERGAAPSPPGTSRYQQQDRKGRDNESQCEKTQREHESVESRALKDFSIESLLQEGLYPKMPSVLDRRNNFSPLFPGFYHPMWAAEFPGFPQQVLDPNNIPSHHTPTFRPSSYPGQLDNRPLDLAVKREVIKEELKEEVPPSMLHGDFLKDFVTSGLSGMGVGMGVVGPEGSHLHLGQIKDEADIRSYLNFLSASSHLGALFPPWQLEEERKMKPKASQQCPICNKVIQGAGKLPRHMRTHTGEKPYMCTICEVRFTRQDKLKIHMRKHTGERPYICLHCNSKFVHNYDLKNHLRIHTGVRPYQCEHCYKSFTRSDHLHRHIKRQSCRVSRPRRGRKPAAWRSANNFLQGHPGSAGRREDSKPLAERSGGCRLLPPSHDGVKGRGLGLGGRERLALDLDSDSRESREGREPGPRLDRKHVVDETERQRGVFTFALARPGEEVLTHPPFYTPTPDPWTMRLENHAPPVPEPAN